MTADKQALGLIETRGLLPLVAAVDAAVKAAQVKLKQYERPGGGLATAFLAGEVAALQAALAAARAAFDAFDAAGRTHLIPGPAPGLWELWLPPIPPAPPDGDPPAVAAEAGGPLIGGGEASGSKKNLEVAKTNKVPAAGAAGAPAGRKRGRPAEADSKKSRKKH